MQGVYMSTSLKLEDKDKAVVSSSGIDLSEKSRSASFYQQDSHTKLYQSFQEGFDILSTEGALAKYPQAKEYYGKNFRLLSRDFPQDTEGGYFIRVKKGKTIELPIQACLF